MLGTSAGAQNLSAYMCNQQGYARKVITRYTTSRQFFDPMRFVRGGNLIDLDWLVEATSQQMPLAMNYAEAQFALGKSCGYALAAVTITPPAIFRRRRKRGWI